MCAQTHTLAIKHSPESIQASLAFPQLCLGGKCQPSGCRGSLGGLNVSSHSLIQPVTQPRWNQPWDLSPRAQEEPDSLCLVRHSLAWSHKLGAALFSSILSSWERFKAHGSIFPVPSYLVAVQHPLTCICTPKFC